MTKYKNGFMKEVREQREFQQAQISLKKKHGIAAESEVVVVEKAHLLKFLFSSAGGIIRIAAIATILVLAVIGLAALLFPEPRVELQLLLMDALKELNGYIGG